MDVTKVSAGAPAVGGCVYIAPANTTLPTDASTALSSSFKELGYISDAGLTNSNSPSNSNVKEWGGNVVLSILSEKPDTFAFKLLEVLNVEVLKTVYGASNVTEASGKITINATATQPSHNVWVFDMVLNDDKVKRIVVPDAVISSVGDIAYVTSDATGFDLTITSYPDSSNVTHIEYIE